MTKVLFVEKRYSHDGTEPSVSIKWIELPDGEEQAFVMAQIFNSDGSSFLEEESICLNDPTSVEKSSSSLLNVEALSKKQRYYIFAFLILLVFMFMLATILTYIYVSKTTGWQ
jgi:hypothetical protein